MVRDLWHSVRQTFTSRLVMSGVNLKTVQDWMGHKTIAMTARYAHLAPDAQAPGAGNRVGSVWYQLAAK
jgi:integrase